MSFNLNQNILSEHSWNITECLHDHRKNEMRKHIHIPFKCTYTHMPMCADRLEMLVRLDGCNLSPQFSVLGICRPLSLIGSGGPVFPSTGYEMTLEEEKWIALY